MNEERKFEIISITVEGDGNKHNSNGKIQRFYKNGEMANVEWFSQTLKNGRIIEYNGKYIIAVELKDITDL